MPLLLQGTCVLGPNFFEHVLIGRRAEGISPNGNGKKLGEKYGKKKGKKEGRKEWQNTDRMKILGSLIHHNLCT